MARVKDKASKFIDVSRKVNPSTKTRKSKGASFRGKSQFAGIGRGVAGDPRK